MQRALLFLVLLLGFFAALTGCGSPVIGEMPASSPPPAAELATRASVDGVAQLQTRAPSPTSTVRQTRPPVTGRARTPTLAAVVSGFDTIAASALPSEARDTIRLIHFNGPFPYRQDGQVFQNREGILPPKPSGYYHEYTVVTPGSSDRGARRIILGKQGEMFYTGDHYNSFKVIATDE